MEVEAKKKYGQNFLKDEFYLKKIVESMSNELPVVEIGPGLGDLTRYLLNIQDVVAYEVDQELCSILNGRFADAILSKQLQLCCGDVLDFWQDENLREEAYSLVANLPYYVATRIILKALEDRHCQSIRVMVQKEVAEKFAAQSGEREFCALSVLAQSVGEVNILMDVPPESFTPSPKVQSSVLDIVKSQNGPPYVFEGLDRFLKAAFSQPRKMLLKNLSSSYSKDELQKAFSALGVSTSLRPHELPTSSYHLLYEYLQKGKP